MEELLGIVITKGVKNAMSVVEAMGNPHVEMIFIEFLSNILKPDRL